MNKNSGSTIIYIGYWLYFIDVQKNSVYTLTLYEYYIYTNRMYWKSITDIVVIFDLITKWKCIELIPSITQTVEQNAFLGLVSSDNNVTHHLTICTYKNISKQVCLWELWGANSMYVHYHSNQIWATHVHCAWDPLQTEASTIKCRQTKQTPIDGDDDDDVGHTKNEGDWGL